MRCISLVLLVLIACSEHESRKIWNQGMVSSAHPIASEVGQQILLRGGNAFDAAAAVHFALAVVYPQAGNIGGGGFAVFYLENGAYGSLDFRETAPSDAHRDMFLDSLGNPTRASVLGGLSVGVPGSVAGIEMLHKKYGTLPWQDILAPAVELAENGYLLTRKNAMMLNKFRQAFLDNNPDTIFIASKRWHKGELFVQRKLAATLRAIGAHGKDAFYRGAAAKAMVNRVWDTDGILSLSDLKRYKPVWRETIRDEIDNVRIVSMDMPSSGGLALIQLWKSALMLGLDTLEHNSPEYIHRLVEIERRIYADRAYYPGDADFVKVPTQKLISKSYLQDRMSDIQSDSASPSLLVSKSIVENPESTETTHYTVADEYGNVVAITTTLNGNFGSKVFVPDAGFFLNNEMDDFTSKIGYANQYGLIGSEANIIEPKKRMLSSMTPTIVLKDNRPVFALGSPGGAKIITAVFQCMMNRIYFEMGPQQAIDAARFHHQCLPNKIFLEERLVTQDIIEVLTAKGHKLDIASVLGLVDAVAILEDSLVVGAADITRGENTALGTMNGDD